MLTKCCNASPVWKVQRRWSKEVQAAAAAVLQTGNRRSATPNLHQLVVEIPAFLGKPKLGITAR